MKSGTKVVVIAKPHGSNWARALFGTLRELTGDGINRRATLTDARQAIYWAGKAGELGLAAVGPAEGSRLSPAVYRLEAEAVVLVLECTPDAVTAWGR